MSFSGAGDTAGRDDNGVIEFNLDLLDTTAKTGTYWTGHLTDENYALTGLDAAF